MTIITLGGCAGFRSGYASFPYIGENEPVSEEKYFEFYDHSLVLPGVTLSININNRIRTRDIAVMLVVVPISIDLFDKPYYDENDRFTISMSIIPNEPGFTLNPSEITATVDGQSYKPASTEFRRDLSNDDKRSVIDKEIPLTKNKFHAIDVTFDLPVPTTDRNITLNIGKALIHPQHPAIPIIRFKKVRWKQGYT